MRVGVSIGNAGANAASMAGRAINAEKAGFDTIWLSDHIVNPSVVASNYPYRSDGQVPWQPDNDWYDVIVSMAHCAALTSRIEIAAGVLVLPLREPLALASQLASLDALSDGRVTLGIGAGWLGEEFAAVGVDFAQRGEITDEYVALLRALWSGPVGPYRTPHVDIPVEVNCEPKPAHRIDILVGGTSNAALRRAGAIGDGWYGLYSDPPTPKELSRAIAIMTASAADHGRNPNHLRTVVSVGRTEGELTSVIAGYSDVGVSDVVVRAQLDGGDADAELVQKIQLIR